MQTLAAVLQQIENVNGVAIDDLPVVSPFGRTDLWNVMDFVSSSGDGCWDAIDIDTGQVTAGVQWENPGGENIGSVLYFAGPTGKSLHIALVEASAGLQLAATQGDLMHFERDRSRRLEEYVADLGFANLGGKPGEWSSFIEEWERLPTSSS